VKLYRKFLLDGTGKPVVGVSFGMLGVRPFDPQRPKKYHDVKAAAGTDPVRFGEGGLSVFTDPAAIRIQTADLILCWLESANLPGGLATVPAGDPHYHIEPQAEMTLDHYQALLASTRDLWQIV
jgi:hypothetical protein